MRKYHTYRVAYQQQKFISLSSGDQENPDLADLELVRVCFLVHRRQYFPCVLTQKKGWGTLLHVL